MMDLLQEITGLSHEFGSPDYVKGGGGNGSAKDADTLWIKPSGTTLSGMTPDSFVRMSRAKIEELYQITPPEDSAAREALVKDAMMAAVCADSSGRPSVEAPLHNTFSSTFVVHVHPALVVGMVCAKNGADACRSLFPDALWLDYVDPGYTLCMRVREGIQSYRAENGREPTMVFLKNHGVFVAHDTVDGIREAYACIMDKLKEEYDKAGISTEINVADIEPDPAMKEKLGSILGDDAAGVRCSSPFDVMAGPVSPDHIVYTKSCAYRGEVTSGGIEDFKSKNGYSPRVVIADGAVYGLGSNDKVASLVLEVALDGALVVQLAEAFGGIEYMDDRARDFIENWEVEAYRVQVVS
jgi:rhamnose utilization protein RhaD (predicted bifunctional aldolase and dehydrogenase)